MDRQRCEDSRPLNLLIVVSDTFRWDYLGAYGCSPVETPHLDKLAEMGALFLDAYAEGLPTVSYTHLTLPTN